MKTMLVFLLVFMLDVGLVMNVALVNELAGYNTLGVTGDNAVLNLILNTDNFDPNNTDTMKATGVNRHNATFTSSISTGANNSITPVNILSMFNPLAAMAAVVNLVLGLLTLPFALVTQMGITGYAGTFFAIMLYVLNIIAAFGMIVGRE